MNGCEFEVCKICEKRRHGGVPVLNIVVTFPEYGVFREIADSALEWAKNELFDKVCREYDGDDDPRKKFRFGYEYKFLCEIRFWGDGLISAKTDVTLKDRRTGNTVSRNSFGTVIRESDGALLPIEAFADSKTVKKYRKSRKNSFFIDKYGIILTQSDGKESLLCENISDFWHF